MNNKGFATSTIIYMLIIVFSVLVFSTVAFIANDNKIKNKVIDQAKELLGVYGAKGSYVEEYRYIEKDGGWSNWIAYHSKSDIDHTVDLEIVPNLGSMDGRFDLEAKNIILNIVDGKSYLSFNGSNSCGLNQSGGTFIPNLFYADVESTITINAALSQKRVFSAGEEGEANSNRFGLSFGAVTGYLTDETITLQNKDYDSGIIRGVGTTTDYAANTRLKILFVWNDDLFRYDHYINGVKNGADNDEYDTYGRVEIPELGYFNLGGGYTCANAFPGKIYNVSISSTRVTEDEAMAITSGEIDFNDVINKNNVELQFGKFVEYRTRDLSTPLANTDTYSARYIRDTTDGNTSPGGNHWVEIEGYARFREDKYFNGVVIGGSYTGTYLIDMRSCVCCTSCYTISYILCLKRWHFLIL